jgi:hypothetical protein
MRLEPEQEELIVALVEAGRRNVARSEREFMITRLDHADLIMGPPGNYPNTHVDDVRALETAGLVRVTDVGSRGSLTFYVTQDGFDWYENVKRSEDDPVRQVEEDLRSYLASARFRTDHADAYDRWAEAADLLWRDDSDRELTTIGHKAREAMRAFATDLVERYQPVEADLNPEKTINRLSAVVGMHRDALGERRAALLQALLDYWRTCDGIVQRQEHGAQKGNEPLTHEDGRRVVFHTAVVMVELARTLPAES